MIARSSTIVVTWCCNVVFFDIELNVHCLSPPSCKWILVYTGGLQSKESINDSHLHSTMKTRYKHHPYKYAPHVLEVDLTLSLIISPLNLIIYIPISKEQFKLMDGKKFMTSLLTFSKFLLWEIDKKNQIYNGKILHLLFILKFSIT